MQNSGWGLSAGLGAGRGPGAGKAAKWGAVGEAVRGTDEKERREPKYGLSPGSTLTMHKPYCDTHPTTSSTYFEQPFQGSCSTKEISEGSLLQYCRVVSGHHDLSQHHYPGNRFNHMMLSFSAPPDSPLVGLMFNARHLISESQETKGQQARNSWTQTNQNQLMPIGTEVVKKTDKNYNDQNVFGHSLSQRDEYLNKNMIDERYIIQRRNKGNVFPESASILDLMAKGETMVSELCNISQYQRMKIYQNHNPLESSEILLTAPGRIVNRDQIPNQIIQLAIEGCNDAKNIALAHHKRPFFKNIHLICAKTRLNVQKADSAVANLDSQGVPWVIKYFIFSFVRILDGWKSIKELLNEKHDSFSRIEQTYYSPHIRECFYRWQALTKEMLTHIYKTYTCLDTGFKMEQKKFPYQYYAPNSTTPCHQNQTLQQNPTYQSERSMNNTSQFYSPGPSWMEAQNLQSIKESWPLRTPPSRKKITTLVNPNNYYPLSEQNVIDQYQENQHKYEPATSREVKSLQSWTKSSVPDFHSLESMSNLEKTELYAHLQSRLESEIGKSSYFAKKNNLEMHQRREKEIIPLAHGEKTLIPEVSAKTDLRACYMHKTYYGKGKEKQDFLPTWGQMPSNDPQISQQSRAKPYNVKNPSGNTQQQPTETVLVFDNPSTETVKMQMPGTSITLNPNPKYGIDTWPTHKSRRPT